MPELPEIEAFKVYIKKHCMNKEISKVTVETPKIVQTPSVTIFEKELKKSHFAQIDRLGKYLIITLMPTHQKLVLHFALTGSLSFVQTKKNQVRFSAITYNFADGSALHFTSIRKFEKVWLVEDTEAIPSIKNLGLDALSITLPQIKKIIEKQKTKNIKGMLLDQHIIAGIGNEYADEILYQAGIDPHHRCKDLSLAQIKKMHIAMLHVLKHAITIRTKVSRSAKENQSPLGGDFEPMYLQHHRHAQGTCPKNSNHLLKKTTIAGRTTYYCPMEQK